MTDRPAHGSEHPARSLSIFGAPPDTGNLGVNALFHSILAAVHGHQRRFTATVFDHGFGVRDATIQLDDTDALAYRRVGMRRSRRLHRWESISRYRFAAAMPVTRHPGIRQIRSAAAALDVSGGDSFSDIYGTTRFEAMLAPKEIALQLETPLVLLPQTYGPFNSPRAAKLASRILQQAEQVWARDASSLEIAAKLAPILESEGRLHLGVDMAFGLPARQPTQVSGPSRASDGGPLVGINVSGLLFAESAGANYGLSLDYRRLMRQFAEHLVRAGATVLLIPHVGLHEAGHESDLFVSQELLKQFSPSERNRISIATGYDDAPETKWLVSQLDWFTGARMHATIAALSSDVPVTGLAYSDKMPGVFATCDLGDQVVDARRVSTDDALAQLISGFDQRQDVRRRLRFSMPDIRQRAHDQMRTLLSGLRGGHPCERLWRPFTMDEGGV